MSQILEEASPSQNAHESSLLTCRAAENAHTRSTSSVERMDTNMSQNIEGDSGSLVTRIVTPVDCEQDMSRSETLGRHISRLQSASHMAKRAVVQKLLVGTLGTFIFMISHHIFLLLLDGRPAGERRQFWVKTASNAFSQIAVLFMTVVATIVLSQLVRFPFFYSLLCLICILDLEKALPEILHHCHY